MYLINFIYVVYLVIGLVIGIKVAKQPHRAKRYAISALIIASGFMVYGHAIIDEYFTLMIFIGLLVRRSLYSNFIPKLTITSSIHSFLFYTMVLYFLFQSFRGLLVLEDIRMIRWVVFFIVLGGLAIIIKNHKDKYSASLIYRSSLIYFYIYLFSGLFFELVLNINRFELQGFFWSGTAGISIPLMLYLLSLLAHLDNKQQQKNLVYTLAGYITVLSCTIYYDSRSAQIILLLSSLIYIFKNSHNGWKMLLIISVVAGLNTEFKKEIDKFIPYDFKSQAVVLPVKATFSDVDRIIINIAAYNTINNNLIEMLFGHGWYTARYKMIDESIKIREEYGLHTKHLENGKPLQPTGATALLVDTGFIGVFLYLANYLITLTKIMKHHRNRYLKMFLYLSVIVTFFVANISTMLLLWLIVMPNSPLLEMKERSLKKQIYKTNK